MEVDSLVPMDPALSEAFAAFDDETRTNIAQAIWLEEFSADSIPADVQPVLASPKNSPTAHGDRMRTFLKYLIEHPLSRTASFKKIYERLLPYCDELSPHQAYVIQTGFLGAAATVGYDMMPNKANIQFPRDHEPKVRSQVGWHFFVGSCWDTQGREYGVELMFFQTALFPPALAASFDLTDEENQIVELQFAISEAGGRHFQAEPIVIAGTTGLVGFEAEPFSYHVGRNSIQSSQAGSFFPLTIKAWGVDRGTDPHRKLGVHITLTGGKEYLFQGDNGSMPNVDGIGSLYYSVPNIQLDASNSSLSLDDETVSLERGTFWFDHQWGYITGAPRSPVMRAANNSTNPPPGGWDWFMAQFDGDRQLTVFAPHTAASSRFYHCTGDTPPDVMKVEVAGTYMNPDKSTGIIRGTLAVTDWIKAEHSPNPARYLITDTWYPNRWEFRFDDDPLVPVDIQVFTMDPIVNVAQSGFFANGAQYAEGAVILKNTSGEEVGRGFAESVLFADTSRTKHRLAGLPETDEAIAQFSMTTNPLRLRLANMLYVIRHKKELQAIVEEGSGLEFFTKT